MREAETNRMRISKKKHFYLLHLSQPLSYIIVIRFDSRIRFDHGVFFFFLCKLIVCCVISTIQQAFCRFICKLGPRRKLGVTANTMVSVKIPKNISATTHKGNLAKDQHNVECP